MRDALKKLYLPHTTEPLLTKEKVSRWYANLLSEISQGGYSDKEVAVLKDKHNYYGKYFQKSTRKFFLNHFARNLATSVNYFFGSREGPLRYLEIGAGCGNQLLLMAFLGAEVLGCDIRSDVCGVVKTRKKFYEKISGRELNISVLCEDIFKVKWDTFPKFDAVNFLFSFNDIQSSSRLIELVHFLMKPHGRLVIQDTNPSNYYNRIFRRRDSMFPRRLAGALELHGFRIHSLQGGYALPPFCWNILPEKIAAAIDRVMCRSLFLSPSYHLVAKKL